MDDLHEDPLCISCAEEYAQVDGTLCRTCFVELGGLEDNGEDDPDLEPAPISGKRERPFWVNAEAAEPEEGWSEETPWWVGEYSEDPGEVG